MKQKIRRITVINGTETRWFSVGSAVLPKDVVGRIDDCSLEYEDHIHSMYRIFHEDGHEMALIENCPVIVEYASKSEKDEG